jgi:glycosyltransferase involved in cell wall biosynthesis
VTITFNAEAYLQQTIDSVRAQDYPEIEYIVVDGASTDGTLGIIRRNAPYLSYWVSEPDDGIAEAMNKGLALASGDYVLFLHADDYLEYPGALRDAVGAMPPGRDIAAFSILWRTGRETRRRYSKGWNWKVNFKTTLWHQSVLCRRKLLEEMGGFDTHLRIAMDYEFFLRAYRSGIQVEILNLPLSVMRDTGVSSRLDCASLRARFAEERWIHEKHAGRFWRKAIYRLYWWLYLPYRLVPCLFAEWRMAHLRPLTRR